MPRAKSSPPEELWELYRSIAYLKRYSPDLLADAKVIYGEQLQRFEAWMFPDHLAELKHTLAELRPVNVKREFKTRVYIVSGVDSFGLVMFGMDECVTEHLAATHNLVKAEPIEVVETTPPYFRSALFIFNDSKLVGRYELTSNQLSTLMAVFNKENLINYSGARDDYYGKPRRLSRNDTPDP